MIGEEIEISFLVLLLGVCLQVGLTTVSCFIPTWTRRYSGIKTMLLAVISLYVTCMLFVEMADWIFPSIYLLGWLVVKNFVIGLTFGFVFELVRWSGLKFR